MPEIPFSVRLLVLVALLALGAGVDRLRHGAAATRPREYGYLLLIAVLGGLIGAGLDQVSLAIGPDYFELAKGIPAGPGFRLRVTTLGFQAGLTAGVVVAGVLLVASRDGLPPARLLGWPVGLAALGGPLGLGIAAAGGVPSGLAAEIRAAAFAYHDVLAILRVWGFHAGLYAGALLGLITAAVRLRRAGATAPAPAAPSPPAPPSPAPAPAPPRPPETDR